MPEHIQVEVFKFSELDPKAKEQAKTWWGEVSSHIRSSTLHQMFIERLFEVGYPTMDIGFSLSWCQGDGVAFYTDARGWQQNNVKYEPWCSLPESYRTKRVNLRTLWRTRIRQCYKKDVRRKMYQFIAEGGDVGISITRNSYGHHYSHWNTMSVSVTIEDWPDEAVAPQQEWEDLANDLEKTIQEDVKEFSKELEKAGYAEIEHQTSDETVAEELEANEVRFHKDGRVFRA